MKLSRGFAVFLLVAGTFVLSALVVSAQGLPDTLVECGNETSDMCSVCDLVKLGQNVLNFLIFFSLIFATLLFINAGVLYLFSPANPANISKAHRIFSNTLVGILFILTSWLVVNTIMGYVYQQPKNWRPWNELLCAPGSAAAIPPATTPPPVSGTPPTASATCPPTPLTPIPSGIAQSSNMYCHSCPGGCTLSSTMVSKILGSGLGSASFAWRITEAFPPSGYTTADPTGIHVSACHGNGTCMDANFVGTTATAARINEFIAAARAGGLRAVYEVATASARTTLVNAGVPSGSIIVVAHITAPHFSVYQN